MWSRRREEKLVWWIASRSLPHYSLNKISHWSSPYPFSLTYYSSKVTLKSWQLWPITEYLKYLPTLRVYTLRKSRRPVSLMYRHPFWPRVPMGHHIPLPFFIGPCFALHLSFPVHHWLRTTQGRELVNSLLIWISNGNLRLGIVFLNYKIQQAIP